MRRNDFPARLWWLAGVCCLVYAAMWVGWASGWAWLAAADTATLDVGHRIALDHPGWVTFWDAVCTVFSPVTFRIVTVGLVFYAFATRQVRTAVFLLVSVELSALLTEVAKRLADRPRPDTAMVDALSTSFPSGHAVGTMVAVPALAVVLLPHVRRAYRRWAVAAGIVVIVLVGVGRVALNVHHLSDVIAGWALGYVYLVACLPILRARRVTAADETPEALDTER